MRDSVAFRSAGFQPAGPPASCRRRLEAGGPAARMAAFRSRISCVVALLFCATSAFAQHSPYDDLANSLMSRYHIPSGAIAVVHDGRLIFARGYGRAGAATLFDIASLTKPITSAAILKLHEEGKLKLDARVFDDVLTDLHPLPGMSIVDPRIHEITIRNLLQHTGGWDRDKTFDPMFMDIAPRTPENIARFMMGKPLQYAPGTTYSYSNFGYSLLGRVIEKVTRMPYEEYVRRFILAPVGVHCMRIDRKIAVLDSHGGWLASAVDYIRFVTALNEGRIIDRKSIAMMIAKPSIPVTDSWYGMGWQVRHADGDFNWWHNGSLPNATTLVVRAANGYIWVAFFNSRPKNSDKLAGELDSGMWDALSKMTREPEGDLFPRFVGCR